MKKSKKIINDTDDREVKLLVTFVIVAFMIALIAPNLQLHFIDSLIQYADGAIFYAKPDDKVLVGQAGVGATCPAITSPSSATSGGSTTTGLLYHPLASGSGCFFNTYIVDFSLLPLEIQNSGLFSVGISDDKDASDFAPVTSGFASIVCRTFSLDDINIAGSYNLVDPRLNFTAGYESAYNNGGITILPVRCNNSVGITKQPEVFALSDQNYYLNRDNSTFFSWATRQTDLVRTTFTESVNYDSHDLRYSVLVPANHSSNYWQMQEHPMYPTTTPATPIITDGFFGIDGTTFTMDTGSTNSQRGQVVLFKTFNKTEFSVLPDIRVQGGIMSLSSSDDVHLHVEVRDGSFQAGQNQGNNAIGSSNPIIGTIDRKTITDVGHDSVAYFELNKFMSFMNSTRDTLYSLGVYDLEDPTVGTADNFDISFRPNWSNSTSEIITVFVAVQDNSTSGSMIANVTSIELENELKYNFTDITDFIFYEPDCTQSRTVDSPQFNTNNGFNCGIDYSNGLTQINNVTAGVITANVLPTPPNVENLTAGNSDSIYLDWDHDLVNVTGFRIYRTSTESVDVIPYIDGLPSGSATSSPCADSTPSLAPNSYCAQGQSGAGMDLAGKMVADMTMSLRKPSGSTTPAGATFKGAVFNTVVGAGSDFSIVNNSTETFTAPDVPTGFIDYTFTFRPPVNSTDNDDGVGLLFEGWAGGGYEIEAKNNGGASYTPKGSQVFAGTAGTTWAGIADDFRMDINLVNQTKLFYNPYVSNTGNLTTNWIDENTETGHTYFYRVVPLNGNIEGDTAFIANFTEPDLALQVDQVYDSRAHLTWEDVGSDYYQVFKNGTMIANLWEENLFIDGNILIDKVYEYRVRGYDTTLAIYTTNSTAELFGLIEKVTNFNVERLNSTSVQLTWTAPTTSDPDPIESVLIQRRNTDYISENFEPSNRFLGERYANDEFPAFYNEGVGDNFKLVWDHIHATGGSGQGTLSCPNYGLRAGQLGSFGTPAGITQIQNCITFEIDNYNSINGSSLHFNATSNRLGDPTQQLGANIVKRDIPISEIDRVTFQKRIDDAFGQVDSGHAGGTTGYGINYKLENGTQRTIAVETRDDRNCTTPASFDYYVRGEEFCHDVITTSKAYTVVRGIDDRPSDIFVTTTNAKFVPFTIDANATTLFSTLISSSPTEIAKIETWDLFIGGYASADSASVIFPSLSSTYGFDIFIDDIKFKYHDGSGNVPVVNWQNVTTVSPATTSYIDNNANGTSAYTYRIVAITNPTSPFTFTTIEEEEVGTIDDLQVFPITSSIFMNWTAPMGSPDFYLIERTDGFNATLGSDDYLIYHQDRDVATSTTHASSTTFAIAQEIATTENINVTRIDQTMTRGAGACVGAGVLRGTVWNSAGTTVIGSSNATVSGCTLPTAFTSTPTSFYFDPPLQLSSGTTYQFGLNMTGTIDKTVVLKRSATNEIQGIANSAPTDTFPYTFASVAGDWAMNIRIENFTFLAKITSAFTNYTDSGLEDGISYFYRVRGENDIGVAVNGSNIAYTKEPVLDDGNSTVINGTSPLWYYREIDAYPTINQDPIYDFTTTTAGGWDIATATFVQTKSLTAEDTTVSDVFFSPNGTKMYMIGFVGKDVNEYTLSTAWDVSTATFIQLKSVIAQEASPQGIYFRYDGLKMYTVRGSNSINEYDLSNPWDISTVVFLQSFSTVANGLAPFDVNFSPNGTKMYTIDPFTPDDTDEYTLSTPWDISTSTFIQSYNHGAQELTATGQFFKPDGTKMFIVGDAGDDVNEYTLSNPWDISTASFVQTFSPAIGGFTQGIFFRDDGFKMYFITGTNVYEYDLSDNGNNVKIDSGGGSATIAGYGQGWLVKSFNKTDFFGSNITVGWSSNRFGPSLESVSMRVYDGAYNPKNNPDFPLGAGVSLIGGGQLGAFTTTASFTDAINTLSNSSISWGSSTQDFVTLVFSNNDAHTDTYNIMEIQNVTISNIGTWEFNNGTTVTHLRGDTETIYQDFWDVGYYNANSFALNTPENFVATAVNSTVVMDWDDVFDATSYIVNRNGTQIGNPIVSQFTDNFPSLNTLYEYSVYAVGLSGNSSEAFQLVTTNDIPSAPANLTGSMIGEDVLLDWDAPVDNGTGSPSTGLTIIKYNIERKTGVGAFAFLANTTNNTSAYFDTTPISGGNYTWKVRAVNALGFSPFSNTFSIIVTPVLPPNPPTSLTATTVSGSQINNVWVAGVGGDPPTSYVLQRKHVGFTGFVTVATIPFPTLYYNNTGLLSGNTYEFRVRADNGAGSSAYSNIASATTFTVPSAPQTLNAITFNNVQIDLSWASPAYVGGGITTYSIYRETPVGGGFVFVANVSGVTLSYNNIGLTQNTVYNYRVSATNLVGTGVYSNQDNDKTQGVPDPPINLSFTTNGVSTISVDWDNPVYTGGVPITGFSIQQAQNIGGTFVLVTPNHPATPTDKTYVGLLQDTYYIYTIASKNLYGTGAYSANLTASTFDTIQEPENLFGVFDPVFPYNVDLTWSNPFGTPNNDITFYTIQRLQTDNITWMTIAVQGNTTSYSDFSPHNQNTNTYRVKGQTIDQDGQYTLPEVVSTQLIPQIGNITVTNSTVAGNVLKIDFNGTVNECFPTCQLYQVGIIQNGTFQENIPQVVSTPRTVTAQWSTFYTITEPANTLVLINATTHFQNTAGSNSTTVGTIYAIVLFDPNDNLFFTHQRNATFTGIDVQFIRQPIPWSLDCEVTEGLFAPVQNFSIANVGSWTDTFGPVKSFNNAYVTCYDPLDNDSQILSFTSFGMTNGTSAVLAFTNNLGDFLGVPVPFIFILFLAAIWTGRSASTGIIFMAVAIGAMGVLGYFPDPLSGNALITGGFWALIVLVTAIGVFVGKRYF